MRCVAMAAQPREQLAGAQPSVPLHVLTPWAHSSHQRGGLPLPYAGVDKGLRMRAALTGRRDRAWEIPRGSRAPSATNTGKPAGRGTFWPLARRGRIPGWD